MPAQFSGAKFAARYGLNNGPTIFDFFVDGDGLLHFPDHIPDEPFFEVPDPPKPIITLADVIIKLDKALADIAGIKDGTIKPPK